MFIKNSRGQYQAIRLRELGLEDNLHVRIQQVLNKLLLSLPARQAHYVSRFFDGANTQVLANETGFCLESIRVVLRKIVKIFNLPPYCWFKELVSSSDSITEEKIQKLEERISILDMKFADQSPNEVFSQAALRFFQDRNILDISGLLRWSHYQDYNLMRDYKFSREDINEMRRILSHLFCRTTPLS